MVSMRIFGSHRTWEDWFSVGVGLLIGASPVIAGELHNATAVYNAAAIGFLVIAFALLELVQLRRWEEYLESLFGLWLIGSPFMFGYANEGALRFWHFALGAVVVAIAAFELRQDWSRSDDELARHGR